MCQTWCPHWALLSPADSWKVRELLEDSASLYPPFACASKRHLRKSCPSSLAPAPQGLGSQATTWWGRQGSSSRLVSPGPKPPSSALRKLLWDTGCPCVSHWTAPAHPAAARPERGDWPQQWFLCQACLSGPDGHPDPGASWAAASP